MSEPLSRKRGRPPESAQDSLTQNKSGTEVQEASTVGKISENTSTSACQQQGQDQLPHARSAKTDLASSTPSGQPAAQSIPATTVLLLLRAVNVAGHNRIAMKDLTATLVSLGYTEVKTYLQSGNVRCSHARPECKELQAALLNSHNLTVEIFMRNLPDMHYLSSRCPFDVFDPTKVYVYFLAEVPQASVFETLKANNELESCALEGNNLYVHYPAGAGRAKLTLKLVESALGVLATGRNWRTVLALQEMLEH